MSRHVDPLALARGACPTASARPAAPPRRYRLWVMSDLGVDRHPFVLAVPPQDFDAVVVAGNVSDDLATSVAWLARNLDGRQGARPVILVPGNREFWGGRDIADTLGRGREAAAKSGITLLSDSCLRIDDGRGAGLCVLGATLWTDWALHGPGRATSARKHASHHHRDCQLIRLTDALPYLPHEASGAHARSRALIEDALGSISAQSLGFRPSPSSLVGDAGPGDRAVVVTHHAPTARSLPPEALPDLCDEWIGASLASNLEHIMEGWGAPALWVHGHVPGPVDLSIGRTRVVANPRAAAHRPANYAAYDPALVVEV